MDYRIDALFALKSVLSKPHPEDELSGTLHIYSVAQFRGPEVVSAQQWSSFALWCLASCYACSYHILAGRECHVTHLRCHISPFLSPINPTQSISDTDTALSSPALSFFSLKQPPQVRGDPSSVNFPDPEEQKTHFQRVVRQSKFNKARLPFYQMAPLLLLSSLASVHVHIVWLYNLTLQLHNCFHPSLNMVTYCRCCCCFLKKLLFLYSYLSLFIYLLNLYSLSCVILFYF